MITDKVFIRVSVRLRRDDVVASTLPKRARECGM
jgi:hypothetical protein